MSETGRQTLGALMLMFCAPGKFNAQAARFKQRNQLAPVTFRPVLVVARRGMQENEVATGVRRRTGEKMRRDGVIALRLRLLIAQAFGKQLTGTFYRMLLFIDLMTFGLPPAGERLARAAAILTMFNALSQACRSPHHIHVTAKPV